MSIDAMKQALEALNAGDNEVLPENYGQMVSDAILALRAAIKEAQHSETEAELYKRLYELRGKALERPCINCGHQPAKIKTMAQPKQEPVGWFGYDEKISTWFETNEGEDDSVPLYAGARGWKGLTLEETVGIELSLRQYHDGDRYDLSLSDFARAIEAKLKEKNNG